MGNEPVMLLFTKPGEAERLKRLRLDYEEAVKLARQAQALSDPTRLTLLHLLREAKETCVGDLCLMMEREQGGVSRHLRVLWDAGLVKRQPFNRMVFYKPSEDGERLLAALLKE